MEEPATAPAEITFGESQVTVEWVEAFAQQLEATTWKGPEHLKMVLPQKLLCEILERITSLCKADPTLVEVTSSNLSNVTGLSMVLSGLG